MYIVMALRRQQVAQAVNPAEDNNSFYLIVFVPLRLCGCKGFLTGRYHMLMEVKLKNAKCKGSQRKAGGC